jgi:superfamily I DNA/RNA helicase
MLAFFKLPEGQDKEIVYVNGPTLTDALAWAGTFHRIGARLLREYSEQIGLNPVSQSMTAKNLPTLRRPRRSPARSAKGKGKRSTANKSWR